ncbi:alpha/beta-hydrolase, partial [Saccharata proteae CBS 121410]
PSVTIADGVVIGTATSTANVTVNKFLGIPYAAAPTGSLRFAPPQPAKSWTSPLNATAYGHACMQQSSSSTLLATESEDCLYLNVLAPSTAKPSSNLTVLVWIHGGALESGSAAIAYYDGTSFVANQDIVFVSINYRLNAFGFSNAAELPLTKRNAGFYDQRLALQWVQDNIAAFGGDPEKVTVFGESSGSTSVSRLVNTMPVDPPFRAAIMESGVYEEAWVGQTLNEVSGPAAWTALASSFNCTNTTSPLTCMRSVDATSIKTVVNDNSWRFTPTNDNITQLLEPKAALRAGAIAKVPVMMGQNTNEGTLFTAETTFADFIDAYPILTPYKDQLEAAYPVGSPGISNEFYMNAAIVTDAEFTCPISLTSLMTASLGIPVWRYYFNTTFPNTAISGFGVYHTAEIPLVFGTYSDLLATEDEMALSSYMQTAWASFAKDPVAGPGWPRVSAGRSGHGSGNVSYAVGVLGGPENTDGLFVTGNGTVDRSCGIYTGI